MDNENRTISVDAQFQVGADYDPIEFDEDKLRANAHDWVENGLEGLLGHKADTSILRLEIEGVEVNGVHLHEPGE